MNKKRYSKSKCISTSFQGIFIIVVFFFKNERKISLHLHVSKKSRVVGKYKGGFLGIELSLLWKATRFTSCNCTHSEKTFQLNQEM